MYSHATSLASAVNRSRQFCSAVTKLHLKCFSATVDATKNNKVPTNNDCTNLPRLSVAIVGAGPSGFYAAKYLTSSVLKRIQSSGGTLAVDEDNKSPPPFRWSGIDIDIIERLPTPYGLVRYGVAPDHPEVKNVENDFASLFQMGVAEEIISKNIDDEHIPKSISYFGNVDVGKDISLSQLQSLYHIVILAYGCQDSDRRLGIPGEDTLEGVLSSREFVAWYNGHPEYGHIGELVRRCLWQSPQGTVEESSSDKEGSASEVSPARVVVIGQGNVALDVARVLAKGKPGLIETDTPDSVLNVLKGGVSHVSVVGRRGHVQGAFTIKVRQQIVRHRNVMIISNNCFHLLIASVQELRELTKLKKEGHDATLIVRKDELDLGMTESSVTELKGPSGRPKTRINKLLQDSAASEDIGLGELLLYLD